jgi:hypothetical protein
MDQQTYAAMMALLHEIDGKVDGIGTEQHCIEARMTKTDIRIGRLWLAVFGGGPILVAAVGYLYVMHLVH